MPYPWHTLGDMSLRVCAALCVVAIASCAVAQDAPAASPVQQSQQQEPFTLRTQANVVLVPATVQTKKNEVIYALKADQFVVEDNGVAQTVHLDEDTDVLGLTLVVLVQCSRDAVAQYGRISGLGTMVESLVGGAPRQVAVASYGKEATILTDFSSDVDAASAALQKLEACDESVAATFDAVAWASAMLDEHKDKNRHAILLVSETRDHGSQKKPADVIAALGRTNTVVDAISFSPGKSEILSDLRYGGGSGPIGLMVMAVNAAKKNAPKTLASLSGGEYVNFTTQKGFDNSLHQLSNRIHNYYLLSFVPKTADNGQPVQGLHNIMVKVPEYPDAKINSRQSYYSGPVDGASNGTQ